MNYQYFLAYLNRLIFILLVSISTNSTWASQLTKLEVANIMQDVGFPPPVVPIMTCISHHESSWRPDAHNYNTNGTIDYGLMQVNTIWLHSCNATPSSILNVHVNAKCAHLVYQEQGLTAWVTFNKFRKECMRYEVPGYKADSSGNYFVIVEDSIAL